MSVKAQSVTPRRMYRKSYLISTDSMKQIEFRLNSSPTQAQERNISNILINYEKMNEAVPFPTKMKEDIDCHIEEIKKSFHRIEEYPEDGEIYHLWELWDDFERILMNISEKGAFFFAKEEIQNLFGLTEDILINVKEIAAPSNTFARKDHITVADNAIKQFNTLNNHFNNIFNSSLDCLSKIRCLEETRNKIRQFKLEITNKYSKIIKLLSNKIKTDCKNVIDSSLDSIISIISNLKRQHDLIQNIGIEIPKTRVKLDTAIAGFQKALGIDRLSVNTDYLSYTAKKRTFSTPVNKNKILLSDDFYSDDLSDECKSVQTNYITNLENDVKNTSENDNTNEIIFEHDDIINDDCGKKSEIHKPQNKIHSEKLESNAFMILFIWSLFLLLVSLSKKQN